LPDVHNGQLVAACRQSAVWPIVTLPTPGNWTEDGNSWPQAAGVITARSMTMSNLRHREALAGDSLQPAGLAARRSDTSHDNLVAPEMPLQLWLTILPP
jgi:hypothetical protein